MSRELAKIMELGLLTLDGDYVVGYNGAMTDDSDLYQALLWAHKPKDPLYGVHSEVMGGEAVSCKDRFKEALREVVADENKRLYWMSIHKGDASCVATRVSPVLVVYAFANGAVGLKASMYETFQVRHADGNLIEAVRFAENLRRLLSGEPPLEIARHNTSGVNQ